MRYIWQHADWPNFHWRSDRLLNALGRARLWQGKLLGKVHALDEDPGREARAEIMAAEAVKSAEIEGAILPREAVRASVDRRLGLSAPGSSMADPHIEGLVALTLDAAMKYAEPLTPERLKAWHAALFPTGFSGLRRAEAGRWRNQNTIQLVSGPVERERVHFETPPSNRVDLEMKKYISWWEKGSNHIEGLLRAAIAHFRFITIHPFVDGNGHIARALTHMALARDEGRAVRFYSLSARMMAERDAYYDALERSQKGDCDITPWLLYFLECFQRVIQDSEALLSRMLLKSEFWRKHGPAILTDRQRKVVNHLLDAGPGDPGEGLTTRQYVSITRVSRATAYREISDLVKKRILLKNHGRGRNVNYDLAWSGEKSGGSSVE
ncbi:MAG: Fic family protein [Desulfobacterales bacterium]|nr:Fic family protein [Desulfobacterales bacterium]